MSLRDIPWLSHQQATRAHDNNMAERNINIPLEPFAPPPTYRKTQQADGPESVHNHYHIGDDQRRATPWYRRKWAFWTMVGLLIFFVVAGLVIMGVVLKVELGKKAAEEAAHAGAAQSSGIINTASSLTLTTPTETSESKSSSAASASASAPSEAQPTATPFTMSDRSQLASAYVKASDAALSRRLLIRQEDTNHLLVTEWANGQVAHYRIKDRLGSSFPTEPKPGTPLALQADASGTLHLFYLSRSNIVSYVYEPTAGKWRSGEVSNEHGSIRTSAYSGLSAAWHNGRRASALLVVAFDDASQQLQLAMTDSPAERGSWYLARVTSLSKGSVPGQSNVPCYSLAGDWFRAAQKKQDGDNQRLLMAVVEGSEVNAWECAVDFWPPPDVQVQCNEVRERFHDGAGKGLVLVPPPTQLAWISLNDGQDRSVSNYDFDLFTQDGSGTVRENTVGAGITRGAGAGFTAQMPIRAISTTSEGIVFASSGKDVFTYRKQGSRWRPDVGTNVTFQA
ncbi:hypothetical protein EsDP_00003130 [Epichloe bromicola]|uniref:Fucose-specific lectin n=1 Tax=Epichloe bromicola TaxID=79588 RepID=A0ABQ0CMU1_9HYPO